MTTMTLVPILTTAAVLLVGVAYAADTASWTGSSLQVQIPPSLNKPGGYDHVEAFFGSYPYGASITQTLYYSLDDDLCGNSGRQSSYQPPFILMVDRGGCPFVEKVRNAQHTGASAVLLADTTCLCPPLDTSTPACTSLHPATPASPCQSNLPVLYDDGGSGGDITIPTMLLFRLDADAIRDELERGGMVQVRMGWSLPGAGGVREGRRAVEYEIWSSPGDGVGREFVVGWRGEVDRFGGSVGFTPRFYVYDGVRVHCQSTGGSNMCFNLCTNSGRYCALDPDGDPNSGISGSDIVTESLRRICIWNHYGSPHPTGAPYWDYLLSFTSQCDNPQRFTSSRCIDDVYRTITGDIIDPDVISGCMVDSGGTVGNVENRLLERELEKQEERGIVYLPMVLVNGVVVRGSLTVGNVREAICAAFGEGGGPGVCSGVVGMVGYDGGGEGEGRVSVGLFVSTLVVVCGVFGVGGYVYRRKVREGMQEEVRGILAEYMPLEGGEGDQEDRSRLEFARSSGGV